ncbi:MAG TPA: hypothetical protein PLX15_05485 [Candidatus Woesearchaeota archaeon]|nr:hypothetical protein [Candidatus Woesearchaeota archaeon]
MLSSTKSTTLGSNLESAIKKTLCVVTGGIVSGLSALFASEGLGSSDLEVINPAHLETILATENLKNHTPRSQEHYIQIVSGSSLFIPKSYIVESPKFTLSSVGSERLTIALSQGIESSLKNTQGTNLLVSSGNNPQASIGINSSQENSSTKKTTDSLESVKNIESYVLTFSLNFINEESFPTQFSEIIISPSVLGYPICSSQKIEDTTIPAFGEKLLSYTIEIPNSIVPIISSNPNNVKFNISYQTNNPNQNASLDELKQSNVLKDFSKVVFYSNSDKPISMIYIKSDDPTIKALNTYFNISLDDSTQPLEKNQPIIVLEEGKEITNFLTKQFSKGKEYKIFSLEEKPSYLEILSLFQKYPQLDLQSDVLGGLSKEGIRLKDPGLIEISEYPYGGKTNTWVITKHPNYFTNDPLKWLIESMFFKTKRTYPDIVNFIDSKAIKTQGKDQIAILGKYLSIEKERSYQIYVLLDFKKEDYSFKFLTVDICKNLNIPYESIVPDSLALAVTNTDIFSSGDTSEKLLFGFKQFNNPEYLIYSLQDSKFNLLYGSKK